MRSSSAADLASGNRGHPTEGEVERNSDNTDDPERLGVIRAIIHEAKYDAKDHAAEVTGCTGTARNNTIGLWVDMWDETEVAPITCLEEYSH